MDEEKKCSEVEECDVKAQEDKMKSEERYRLASPWLCHLLSEPLWPTEGGTRGNDVY